MLMTVSITTTDRLLQANRSTWLLVADRLGHHSRSAQAVLAAVEAAPNPDAIRIRLPHGIAEIAMRTS